MIDRDKVTGMFLGIAIGDALGEAGLRRAARVTSPASMAV